METQIYKFEDKPLVIADPSVVEGGLGWECFDVIPEEMEDIRKLGEVMIRLCAESGGLGLAAPQVGIMKKMFVWSNAQNQFQIVVNPVFFPDGKTTNVVEGCLTYPGKQFFLKRYKAGNARSDMLDPNDNTKFKRLFKKLSGERSLIWQHELDHLSGITIATKGKPFEVGEKQ
jgi:peptide deformylase